MKFDNIFITFLVVQLFKVNICIGANKRTSGVRLRRCRRNEDPMIVNCARRRSDKRHQFEELSSIKLKQTPTTSAPPPPPVSTNKNGILCPPCDRLHCIYSETTINCPGGIVLGVCGCCPICAKQEGEDCGGRDNYLGTCDKDLSCQIVTSSVSSQTMEELSQSLPPSFSSGSAWKGKCKAVTTTEPPSCRPECSPEFCSKKKTALCSARFVAAVPRDCQNPCHHTSCKACYFQEVPKCKKCSKDDFRCLKSYAKCIKKFRYCKNEKRCLKRRKPTESFRCWVPECA